MEKEILRVLTKLEQDNWITINKDLQTEALAKVFMDYFRDMKVSSFLDIFKPKDF